MGSQRLLSGPELVDGGGDERGEEDADDGAEGPPHIRGESRAEAALPCRQLRQRAHRGAQGWEAEVGDAARKEAKEKGGVEASLQRVDAVSEENQVPLDAVRKPGRR